VALKCWRKLRSLWADRGVEYYKYQVAAAERVIKEMDGRAILADEVGLGKTLVIQWRRELKEKFDLDFQRIQSAGDWSTESFIITSIDLAKRDPQRTTLVKRRFDLVVVDEAHILKNHRTMNHQLVKWLQSRYLLLLSATPLQNDLIEYPGPVPPSLPHRQAHASGC